MHHFLKFILGTELYEFRTGILSIIRSLVLYTCVSQPSGRGPVPGPGTNYTGPREALLEFVILVFFKKFS